MDLGIPVWKRGSPFPYGDLTQMDPPVTIRDPDMGTIEVVQHGFIWGLTSS